MTYKEKITGRLFERVEQQAVEQQALLKMSLVDWEALPIDTLLRVGDSLGTLISGKGFLAYYAGVSDGGQPQVFLGGRTSKTEGRIAPYDYLEVVKND